MTVAATRPAGFRLSPQQRRSWRLAREECAEPYVVQAVVRLRGGVDAPRLSAAVERVAKRFEILRTAFIETPELTLPLQAPDLEAPVLEVTHDAQAGAGDVEAVLAAERERPLDAVSGPLVHLTFRPEDGGGLLLVTASPLCLDPVALRVLVDELEAALHDSPLPADPLQYADLAEWQSELLELGEEQGEATTWRRELRAAQRELRLPCRSGSEEPFRPRRECRGLQPELEDKLRSTAGAMGGSPADAVLAAWTWLIARQAGQPELTVGVALDGRSYEGLEDAVGPLERVVPVRLGAPTSTFAGAVAAAAAAVVEAVDGQEYFDWELLEETAAGERTPFLPLVFAHRPRHRSDGVDAPPYLSIEREYDCLDQCELRLTLREVPEGYELELLYDAAHYRGEDAVGLLDQVEALLGAALARPDSPLATLDVRTDSERQLMAERFRPERREWAGPRTLHEAVAQQARRTPQAEAVRDAERGCTYRELMAEADAVARLLASCGVAMEDRVGVLLERSVGAVAAFLGVLRSGGAFVPLDPELPEGRLRDLCAQSNLRLILTTPRLRRLFAEPPPAPIVLLGSSPGDPQGLALATAAPENLAYVLFTSGSTGRPKGVAVEHRQLLNYVHGVSRALGLEAGCSFAHVSTLSADLGYTALFPPLCLGGSVLLIDPEEAIDPALLARRLAGRPVDGMKIVPGHLETLLSGSRGSEVLPRRWLVLGGEPLRPALLDQIARLAPECRIFNHYGPTETTVGVLVASPAEPVEVDGGRTVPLGRPLDNARIHLLDARLRQVPVWVEGEIFVGGRPVSRGYFDRPGMTAERFLPDPDGAGPGARMYRTGDRARLLSGGAVEFLGRIDDQVKIRGFRIEPGDVAARIEAHEAVAEVAVVTSREGGEPHLIAYVVAQGDSPESDELREFLRFWLPEVMIPSAFVHLPALPRTSNGKLDHAALPAAVPTSSGDSQVQRPEGHVEQLVAAVWSDLLGVDAVSRDDDFFQLGGHSLHAAQAVARLRELLGVELAVRELFDRPDLPSLVARIEGLRRAERGLTQPPLLPVPRDGEPPLSFAQQRLWVLDRLHPGRVTYNVPRSLRLRGSLDPAALAAALTGVVGRHEVLRTVYPSDGEPRQRILPARPVPMPVVDVSALPPEHRKPEGLRVVRDDVRRPFDLPRGPVVRSLLVRLDPRDHRWNLNIHHIASDGWSTRVLVSELKTLYEARRHGGSAPLPELPVQYADFAVWQRLWLRGDVLAREVELWRARLEDLPRLLELPLDRPRPPVQSEDGARVRFELSEETTRRLGECARSWSSTPFMVLLATWQTLLHRYSGSEDFAVGSPVAGRDRVETERLIGFFANTLVLRARLLRAMSFREAVAAARETVLDATAHQTLPFEKLVDELEETRDTRFTPLFQTVLVLGGALPPPAEISGLELQVEEVDTDTAKFDLTLWMGETDGGMRGSLEYRTELFDRTTAQRIVRHFHVLLRGALEEPESRLAELSLLTDGERQQTVREWGEAGGAVAAVDIDLPSLFAAQVARSPAAVALVAGDERLSYGDLAARVHRLAHHLRGLGVRGGAPVALFLERSPEAVVALLAVLHAGGCYVPLDPHYPARRVAMILSDCGARVLVTSRSLCDRLKLPDAVVTVLVDGHRERIAAAPAVGPQVRVHPDQPAYVIYTSGSTGRPKGVVVSHRNVVRLLTETREHFAFGSGGVWTLFHSYAFDFSVWEIWGALAFGGVLVVVPYRVSRSPESFRDLLARERVTVLNQTPSGFYVLAQAIEEQPPLDLRWVIFGGEALDPARLGPWIARWGDRRPRLVNMYGITETTVHVTQRRITSTDTIRGRSVIGRQIPDLALRVLDRSLRPLSVGEPGEICVGGPGLAQGYLGRSALTAERFVPDPYGTAGARLYRSGDLARRLPDGDLEFLGRDDQQVKVRGFRIEPGEIENRLLAHPAVRQAVIVARSMATGGDSRLVAYWVPSAGRSATAAELRKTVADALPEYMVPALFMQLEELPLTASGKLDRRSLPEPRPEPPRESPRRAPETEREELLAAVWSEVLGISKIGADDNFFALGGDSILAIRVAARCREAGLAVTPWHLFQAQTVAALAAEVGVEESGSSRLPGVPPTPGEPLPPLPMHRWFFAAAGPRPDHWNQSVLLAAPGGLDLAALSRAVRGVLERHEALRLRFPRPFTEGVPSLVVGAGTSPVPLSRVDLSQVPDGSRDRVAGRVYDQTQASLDLAEGPLLRSVHVVAGDRSRLLLSIHHVAVDAVSWSILLEDLEALYLEGRPAAPVTTGEAGSFVRWSHRLAEHATSAEVEAQAPAWREVLQADAARLPLASRGPGREGDAASLATELGEAETHDLLHRAPQDLRARPEEILLAALGTALRETFGGPLWRVAMEGHGRVDLGIDLTRTVGWLTALYPLPLETGADEVATLRSIKQRYRDVPEGGVGFGLLRYRGRLPEVPEPEISFNYVGRLRDAAVEGRLFRLVSEPRGREKSPAAPRRHALQVHAAAVEGRLAVRWSWSPDQLGRTRILSLASSFRRAVARLVRWDAAAVRDALVPSDFPLARVDASTLRRIAAGGEVEDLYPLSPLQRGMLVHTLRNPGSGAYTAQVAFDLAGPVDAEAMASAWRRALARHPALRTAFEWRYLEEPLSVVRTVTELPFEVLEPSPPTAVEEVAAAERSRGFDLTSAPLMRLVLVPHLDGDATLLWTYHHLLMDGWSVPRVLADVTASLLGRSPGPRPRPFRDYVAWTEDADREAAASFWRAELAGIEGPMPLPWSRRGTVRDGEPQVAVVSRRLPLDQHAKLQAFSQRHGVTLSTLIAAAWTLVLTRHGGGEEAVFGMTVSGRTPDLAGVEEMVGLFANTLPVRAAVSEGTPVVSWLRALQGRLAADREHGHVSLAEVAGWSGRTSDDLFESLVVFENYPLDEAVASMAAEMGVRAMRPYSRTEYPLTLLAAPGNGLLLRCGFDRRRLLPEAGLGVLAHVASALEDLCSAPEAPLGGVPSLTATERHHLLRELNDTRASDLPSAPLHELFLRQARRVPERVAVVSDRRRFTYGELDRRAKGLARRLLARGVRRGEPMAVLQERSPEQVVALLGVMMSGAAYLPLDPALPALRIEELLQGAGARMVVTNGAGTGLPPGVSVVPLEGAASPGPLPDLDLDDLAYAIYTSGSSGRAKAVAVPHRGIANRILSATRCYGLDEDSHALQTFSYSFDASVPFFFQALATGASVLLARPGGERDAAYLAGRMAEEGVRLAGFSPGVLELLVEEPRLSEAPLEYLASGIDALGAELLKRVESRLPRTQFAYGYGPTEASVSVTRWVGRAPVEPVPVGRPIDNASVFVLSSRLQPQPAGAPGELCIGGQVLARGYLRCPAETAAAFVPDPFVEKPGRCLYRTGDLGRHLSDGSFQFLGRLDRQVKVRGHRIELEEIESVLLRHPGIEEAAVVAPESHDGDRSLVAWVVPRGALDPEGLRTWLGERLPSYMVPQAIRGVAELPRTTTGKLDRRALTLPVVGPPGRAKREPRGPIEAEMAGIWSDLLDLPAVGPDDDFFALGGHSLTAMRLMARVRRSLEVDLPLETIFKRSTLRAMAESVEEALGAGREAPPAIRPRSGKGAAPASFAQRRLWFLERLAPGDPAYNLVAGFRVRGVLDREALARAVLAVVVRHRVLRSRFSTEEGEPVQVVLPMSRTATSIWRATDLGRLPAAARDQELRHLAEGHAALPFNLERGPLLRALLVGIAKEDHALLLAVHHTACDGWSMGILARELEAFYDAFRRGVMPDLPRPPLQYADFAAWQREELEETVLASMLERARHRLSGAPPLLELPTDRPRGAFEGSAGAVARRRLPRVTATAVGALARRSGTTPFTVFLAAFAALLGRHAGTEDLTVGVPVAGRGRPELEDLIGLFLNTLVLRADLTGRPGFSELVRRMRRETLAVWPDQELPFERLVEELQPRRSLAHSPLFQVMLVLQQDAGSDLLLDDLVVEPLEIARRSVQLDLTLFVQRRRDGWEVAAHYRRDLFDRTTIDRFLGHYGRLIETGAAAPEHPVAALEVLGGGERHQVLEEWSATGRTPARVRWTLPERLAWQAASQPEAVAVISGDRHLTYCELLDRAGGLAGALAGRGVGAETRVGVLLERDEELVVALVAVLLSGGTYVPLDPAYPEARLALMVEDSGAVAVLTRHHLAARLPSGTPVAMLDDLPTARPVEAAPAPEQVAYVIYTSGSTGRPKGVAVTHGSAAERMAWAASVFGSGELAGVLAATSVCFDLSVFELFAPLSTGGTVILARDALTLPELPARDAVTLVNTVPSALAAVVREHDLPSSLQAVNLAGEPLPGELSATLHASGQPGLRVFNLYGPSEDTTYSTGAEIPADEGRPPIGRPLPGTRTCVVDPELRPVPPGVAGELVLGGVGLARGYLARPAATAERFVPQPGGDSPGGRLYVTGDLVRHRPDGRLEYLGRRDDQVKVRGFRLELGEVEAALVAHPHVREAAAAVDGDPRGEVRLVAYWVPESEAPRLTELRRHLESRLPAPVVPTLWVRLEGLPRTPNGKLDRRRLPAPEPDRDGGDADFLPPRTATEQAVVELWKEVLGVDRIGVHDDFFLLGGHSLAAVRLLARVHETLGVEVPLRLLFERPTPAAVAEAVEGRCGVGEPPDLAALLDLVETMPEEEVFERLRERLGAVEENDG